MAAKWTGKTDGTPRMQRALIRLLRRTDIRLMYAVMVLWLPFYMLFRPSTVRVQYRLFRERLGYSRMKSMRSVCRNFYNFGQVVIDRFAAHAGKRFEYVIENKELFYDLADTEDGFIVLSSHLGNFEMAGYELTTPKKKMNVVLYAGDTEVVMENRERILASHNIALIPLQKDMSHVYAIGNALSNGEIVAMPADRRVGDGKTVSVPVLGKEAKLPMGPFALAVTREDKVLVVFVVKDNSRMYHIYVRALPIPMEGKVRERINAFANQYGAMLSEMIRRYPTQLYNYYDFWSEEKWL